MSSKFHKAQTSTQRLADVEVEKLMPIIKSAQDLKLMSNDVDKTPASVTKYSSKNRGQEYSIQIGK